MMRVCVPCDFPPAGLPSTELYVTTRACRIHNLYDVPTVWSHATPSPSYGTTLSCSAGTLRDTTARAGADALRLIAACATPGGMQRKSPASLTTVDSGRCPRRACTLP